MANCKPQQSTNSRNMAWSYLPMLMPVSSFAAENPNIVTPASYGFWDTAIASFVCLVAASVAYLCYGAVRLWGGYWRALAITPLVLLALWVSTLVAGTLSASAIRSLWSFELLFWAMATTVYLVVLFTARRTFEKAALKEDHLD